MRSGISIDVSPADRVRLDAVVADRNSPQKHVWRSRIVLLSADGCGTNEIKQLTGTSKTCVWRWQERYMTAGVDGLLREKTRRPRIAPLGDLVPAALRATAPGGVVVCGGIHMSDIPAFPYSILWMERTVRSVANLTRRDGEEFLALAPKIPIVTETTTFPLDQANEALSRLRNGQLTGAAVLVPEGAA